MPPPQRRSPNRTRQGSTRKRSTSSSISPKRLVALFLCFFLLFGMMAARLVVLQIFQGPAYAKLAADQRQKEVTFAARRGGIFDRSGEPLAISVDLKTVFADPAFVEDAAAEARKLAPLLDMPAHEIQAKLIGSN